MTLYIKNMVCERCIMAVRQQLNVLNFHVSQISLGAADVLPNPDAEQLASINAVFISMGFELIFKEKNILAERIKSFITSLIHHQPIDNIPHHIMPLIAKHLRRDHVYLSRVFTRSEGITIERFIIRQKIEKAKELLNNTGLTITEIAFALDYSSNAHLSAQFKSITGMTPTNFKHTQIGSVRALDKSVRN